MNLVPAKLIRMDTEDGLIGANPNTAYLGKVYMADMDSMQEITCYHVGSNKFHKKVLVKIFDEYDTEGWFPAEILEFPGGQ